MRRIKLRESDGDWHIEITEEESTPVPASCVIVEIPAPANGSRYGQARDQLAGLVDTTHLGANGDLNAPVQVTFTGAPRSSMAITRRRLKGSSTRASTAAAIRRSARCGSFIPSTRSSSRSALELFRPGGELIAAQSAIAPSATERSDYRTDTRTARGGYEVSPPKCQSRIDAKLRIDSQPRLSLGGSS